MALLISIPIYLLSFLAGFAMGVPSPVEDAGSKYCAIAYYTNIPSRVRLQNDGCTGGITWYGRLAPQEEIFFPPARSWICLETRLDFSVRFFIQRTCLFWSDSLSDPFSDFLLDTTLFHNTKPKFPLPTMHFVFLSILTLLILFTTATPLPTVLTANETVVEAGILGETHSNIRFSAVTDYPHSRITNNYGACASAGPDPRYLENDPNSWMVSLDANVPNWGSYCGKRVRLTGRDGRTCEATIVDKCPGCGVGGAYSLDLLEAPWSAVGGKTSADNVYGAKWEIIG
ncbi:hypothetical protein P171DRAFT_490459 [Karstenula rhodostoma CBS 690.94]|uniref:RlpA-like double-psi beta-barrel-protein domain-containing protein-containing protein n=1 Tax=Karstenula rhodostoma CBS 690.94 TaxID=1392251 RepID=A0A9P4P810_9PLEO|nr:hypothetical protein P171DRAFT_490459 [Karstenula rhodostoma CBS 690.94]